MNPEDLPDAIINKGKWCAPLGGDEWISGAGYIWGDLDCQPTEEGKKDIVEGLKAMINRDFQITGHCAGVRPVMLDQKPVLGRHPVFFQLCLMNGLGSKGFLTAPYLAKHLVNYLEHGSEIRDEFSIKRFCGVRNILPESNVP